MANLVVMNNGQRLASGSGFIVNGHLVTCAHVMQIPPNCNLEVRFERIVAGQTAAWGYVAAEGGPQLSGYSDEHSYDYAIIQPPAEVHTGVGLHFAEAVPEVGDHDCCLGYPFDDPHLTLHHGVVSAVFASGVATMIKLDMSINPSNSGGPLIRLSDGKVVGVVARKATGLTRAFGELMQSYDRNITVLQAAAGIANLGGVDPVAALLAGQHQMKAVSAEIARSANVGIGYAVYPHPLREEAALA